MSSQPGRMSPGVENMRGGDRTGSLQGPSSAAWRPLLQGAGPTIATSFVDGLERLHVRVGIGAPDVDEAVLGGLVAGVAGVDHLAEAAIDRVPVAAFVVHGPLEALERRRQ